MAQPDPERPDNLSNSTSAPGGGTAPPVEDEAWADDDFLEDLDEDDESMETVDALGRRHVRRAAPEGTDELLEKEAPRRTGLPDGAERWRMRSATGTVLTAFAMGLQQVFEPERNQPAIIMETSGEPPKDLPVEAQLEQLGPRQSSVTVRPWLLGKQSGDQAGDDGGGTSGSRPGPAET